MEPVVGRDNGGRGSGVIISLVKLPSTGRRADDAASYKATRTSHLASLQLLFNSSNRIKEHPAFQRFTRR